MNTAARMEHTGIRDRVQISQETADLLIGAGKANWVTKREDVVYAKGKGMHRCVYQFQYLTASSLGELQTFWLESSITNSSSYDAGSSAGSTDDGDDEHVVDKKPRENQLDAKTMRLIEWNVDVLSVRW